MVQELLGLLRWHRVGPDGIGQTRLGYFQEAQVHAIIAVEAHLSGHDRQVEALAAKLGGDVAYSQDVEDIGGTGQAREQGSRIHVLHIRRWRLLGANYGNGRASFAMLCGVKPLRTELLESPYDGLLALLQLNQGVLLAEATLLHQSFQLFL